MCAAYTFVSNLTSVVSFFMTALFSLDKCMATVFPFKYREIGKPKTCFIATITVYVFIALVNIPVLLVFDLDEEKSQCRVSNFRIISQSFFEIQMPITIIVVSLMPIFIVLLCTLATAIKLHIEQRKRATRGHSGPENSSPRDRLDAEITKQTMAVCIVFCVLSITTLVMFKINFDSEINSAYDEAIFNLRDRINSIFLSMVYASNFHLYLIFGKKFRADFKLLFMKCENQ